MKFGIVGFGRFGKLWANALLPYGEVLVYDKKDILKPEINSKMNNIQVTTLEEVVKVDILFLIVPISEFENCCYAIKDLLDQNTLVVDCCSVKIHTSSVMKRVFNQSQAHLATHPLFGPDSVKRENGMKGQKMVICENKNMSQNEIQFKHILHQMGLKLLITTESEHDKQMAHSQSLVHFIGRGLKALNLHHQELATPDFEALLNINHMVVHDTWQLFLDMHRYNPYAKNIREKFIDQLSLLDNEINVEKINAND